MTTFATLGGGCFWCLEAVYQLVKGVDSVVSGYSGGRVDDPSYEHVCMGTTGHAEVVQISFDQNIVSYEDLLKIFFYTHDPTTLNRQGNDVGSQYRSAIFYHDEEQKNKAAEIISGFASALWSDPVVTEIVPLEKFWPAEDYHQNYFSNHPEQAYCQIIINPKLQKFRKEFEALLK